MYLNLPSAARRCSSATRRRAGVLVVVAIVAATACGTTSVQIAATDAEQAEATADELVTQQNPAAGDAAIADTDTSDADTTEAAGDVGTPPDQAVTTDPVDADSGGTDTANPDTANPADNGSDEVVSDQSNQTEPGPPETGLTQTRPAAPNGRTAPDVGATALELAAQLTAAYTILSDPTASAAAQQDAGHLHQVAVRKLGYESDWDTVVFEAIDPSIRGDLALHVAARRALIGLHSGYKAADFVPAWEIVDPEPASALIGYYKEAEDATGIEWEYLAAINLVETGIGRIRGLSSAGAQGPMQFLPTTWDEAGIGQGDINDPRDAINAAARYLVRRGGPSDMAAAIFGYNNSDDYVAAVQAYAEALRQNPDLYDAIYNWEIYFSTEAGDIWLPVGWRSDESIDLDDFLTANPWSAPDPVLRTASTESG